MAASAGTAAQVAPVPKSLSKWLGVVLSAVVCLGIIALPTPQGLSRPGQYVLGIAALAVVMWVFQAMNNGIVSILMMALMIFAGIRPALVLSGFASASFWILVCVLFYGFAMQRTGLAERISYYMLSIFPGTYTGINCAFLIVGLVLSLGIPSSTVRTAIMVPIAWALVKSLQLPPRSRGAALIMITAVEMAMTTGLSFLYGSLYGPVVDVMFRAKNLPLSWLAYAKVIALPTVLLCALMIMANQIVLRPESPLKVSNNFAKEKLRALGPLKSAEWVTGCVVVFSIFYWMTDRWHHLPSFLIGMVALPVFALSGIVRDDDVGTGVSWSMLLFMGGVFGLSGVFQEFKITGWLASFMIPLTHRLSFSVIILLVALGIAMYLVRFLEPTGQIALPILFLPLVDVTTAAGIPPLALTGALLIAAGPFWLSYENVWIAMGEGITNGEAWSARQRLRLAHAYAVVALIAIIAAVGYWKLIHVM